VLVFSNKIDVCEEPGSQSVSVDILQYIQFFAFLTYGFQVQLSIKKIEQCPEDCIQCGTHSLRIKFPEQIEGVCITVWLAKMVLTTPGYGFMHLYWSQISREMKLVAVMMIIINNAYSSWILADYQDRLPDDEMHMPVSSPFKVSARHHFLQLQRTADENMYCKKQSRSICPRLLSLISIIVLISTSQTLASQISEQLCQVLTAVAVATQKPAVPCLHEDETTGRGPCHIMLVIDGITEYISFASSRD